MAFNRAVFPGQQAVARFRNANNELAFALAFQITYLKTLNEKVVAFMNH